MSGSGGRDLMRRGDVRKSQILLLSLVASVVVAVAIPLVSKGVTFYESVAVIAAPFAVLGIWELAIRARWISLLLYAAIALALYLLDWRASVAAVMLLFGAVGIASSTDMIQRKVLLRVLDLVEHCGSRPSPGRMDRLAAFMFDIPQGLDARNMKVNRTIVRDGPPWRQTFETMIPALVLLMFLWMFVTASMGFRSDVGDNSLLALAVTMYIVAAVAPCFVLGAMDVRIERSGVSFRLFDGLIGTSVRMAIPTLIGLLVTIVAVDPGWNAVIMMLMSGVFCAALMVMCLVIRALTTEAEFVSDAAGGWAGAHPVDFFSGFDGKDGRYPLDDGVPCTPRRPADACFDQKN